MNRPVVPQIGRRPGDCFVADSRPLAWIPLDGVRLRYLRLPGCAWAKGRCQVCGARPGADPKASVALYRRLVGDASPLTPKQPVDLAASLTAPVLGLYGGADQGNPVSTIEQMKQACQAAEKT